jgi:hypothetical protein
MRDEFVIFVPPNPYFQLGKDYAVSGQCMTWKKKNPKSF